MNQRPRQDEPDVHMHAPNNEAGDGGPPLTLDAVEFHNFRLEIREMMQQGFGKMNDTIRSQMRVRVS